MKKMNRDEYGYINGIGASKYWGVTTSVVGGKRLWIVNIHPEWSDKTLKFRATQSYNLPEVDAARIAAYFYDVHCFASEPQPCDYVRSSCGRWVYVADVSNSLIMRNPYTNQHYYQKPTQIELDEFFSRKSTGDLFVIEETESPEERKQREEENKKVVDLLADLDKPDVYNERELISMVTDGLLENKFSKTGARLLIGLLEQVVYN